MAYRVDCGREGSSMVQSEDEAVEHIKQHAREKPGMDLGDEDACGMIEQP